MDGVNQIQVKILDAGCWLQGCSILRQGPERSDGGKSSEAALTGASDVALNSTAGILPHLFRYG